VFYIHQLISNWMWSSRVSKE